jgi:hypothetical protein
VLVKKYDRVVWKDEGRVGPATYIAAGATTVRPFGEPNPPGVVSYGWVTREEAERLAKTLGVLFEET